MTSDLIHQMRIACPKDYPLGELLNQGADALEKAERERDHLRKDLDTTNAALALQGYGVDTHAAIVAAAHKACANSKDSRLRAEAAEAALKEAIELLKPFAAFAEQAEGFVQARVEQGGSPKLATNRFRVEHFSAARRFVEANTKGGDDENG